MSLVINLFAGPGAGKSTTAADLFKTMKMQGRNVELVTEYAKDLVWSENYIGLHNQLMILAEQDARLQRLVGKVDFIITDSPLLLGTLYSEKNTRYATADFRNAVRWAFNSYNNANFLLTRPSGYDPKGRVQGSREEAEKLDRRLEQLLEDSRITYERLRVGPNTAKSIQQKLLLEEADD